MQTYVILLVNGYVVEFYTKGTKEECVNFLVDEELETAKMYTDEDGFVTTSDDEVYDYFDSKFTDEYIDKDIYIPTYFERESDEPDFQIAIYTLEYAKNNDIDQEDEPNEDIEKMKLFV